jgi:hypothetical protein
MQAQEILGPAASSLTAPPVRSACRDIRVLDALQPTVAHLTRFSLHRCLKRHGISPLPQVEDKASPKRRWRYIARA